VHKDLACRLHTPEEWRLAKLSAPGVNLSAGFLANPSSGVIQGCRGGTHLSEACRVSATLSPARGSSETEVLDLTRCCRPCNGDASSSIADLIIQPEEKAGPPSDCLNSQNLVSRKRMAAWRAFDFSALTSERGTWSSDNESSGKNNEETVNTTGNERQRHQQPTLEGQAKRPRSEVRRDDVVGLVVDDSSEDDKGPDTVSDHGFDFDVSTADPILNSDGATKDEYVSGNAVFSETVEAQRHREFQTEDGQQVDGTSPAPVDSFLGRGDPCCDAAIGAEAERASVTTIDTKELYNTFAGLVNVAQDNPRAADYLKVCLTKCSRVMQAIAAWDDEPTNHSFAFDIDEVEYEC
jgi:hypothetical protein